MSRIRYGVAMSLDGFIDGPNGESDWIVIDPELNFAELWAQFDTALMGRRTWDAALARLGARAFAGMKTFVVSSTLKPADHPAITILNSLDRRQIASICEQSRKDIWLFGGGALFAQLLAMGVVDTIEVTVVPVLLGGGTPLISGPAPRTRLNLASHKVYRSGTIQLSYEIRQ